jgi:hypothetical protein
MNGLLEFCLYSFFPSSFAIKPIQIWEIKFLNSCCFLFLFSLLHHVLLTLVVSALQTLLRRANNKVGNSMNTKYPPHSKSYLVTPGLGSDMPKKPAPASLLALEAGPATGMRGVVGADPSEADKLRRRVSGD